MFWRLLSLGTYWKKWPNLRYSPGSCLEIVETHKQLSHDTRPAVRDSHRALPRVSPSVPSSHEYPQHQDWVHMTQHIHMEQHKHLVCTDYNIISYFRQPLLTPSSVWVLFEAYAFKHGLWSSWPSLAWLGIQNRWQHWMSGMDPNRLTCRSLIAGKVCFTRVNE